MSNPAPAARFDPVTARNRERKARIHGRSPECKGGDCPGCWPSESDELACWPCHRDRTMVLTPRSGT